MDLFDRTNQPVKRMLQVQGQSRLVVMHLISGKPLDIFDLGCLVSPIARFGYRKRKGWAIYIGLPCARNIYKGGQSPAIVACIGRLYRGRDLAELVGQWARNCWSASVLCRCVAIGRSGLGSRMPFAYRRLGRPPCGALGVCIQPA